MSTTTQAPWRDEQRLRELYWDEGLCAREIAEELGCTERTIWTWIGKHDMETRRMGHPRVEHVWFDPCNTDGYPRWKDTHPPAKHEVVYVHTLLAIAEYGFEAAAEYHVHHKNNIKWDNRPENIELVSPDEHYRIHHEEALESDRDDMNIKLSREDAADILARSDEDVEELADEYDVSTSHISNIWNRHVWTSVEPAQLEEMSADE